jgi:c-di-GMP phosphodiesterase
MASQSAEVTVLATALCRQAIFDDKLEAWAYELRYANPNSDDERLLSPFERPSHANVPASGEHTGALVLSAFAEFGLTQVVGKKKAFICVTARALVGGLSLPVPVQRVTLQVQGLDVPHTALIPTFRKLKDQGFDIALDNFEMTPLLEPLLDVADYVKVNVYGRTEDWLRSTMGQLKRHFVEPIAYGISTNEQLRFCVSLGFSGFQGTFLFEPQVLQRTELPNSFVVVSQVLSLLQKPDVDFGAIEVAVKRDVSLSVGVLKFLNSGAYAFKREVSSIAQAVSLLGLKEFTKWLLLVMLSARRDKPSELLMTALVRGRTCENFAKHRPNANPSHAFTVGLLSVMDALLDRPMEELLGELPLTQEIKSAILDFRGPEGEVLELVVTREHSLPDLEFDEQRRLTLAWLEALQWAETVRLG